MAKVVRFGVSLDADLLGKFDKLIHKKKYQNRSDAIRDLIRETLVEEEWEHDQIIAGGIGIVYDHHQKQLVNKLMNIQHDFHNTVVSSQHIHLDHDNCLEIVVVKGIAKEVQDLYNHLKATKGIKHISILRSTTGQELK